MSRSWSPARALAWESLRLSWRPVVTTTLAWCALAAIYRRLLAPLGERRDAEVFSSLLAMMVIVNATTLLSCRDDGVGIGFERRLFRLPLSTSLLVLGRLVPALLYVTAMQAAVALFMRAALGAPWPLLGPGLLALAVASWTLALSWVCGQRPLLIAPLGVVLLFALLTWLRPVLRADLLWSRLTAHDATALVLATAMAALVAMWGVASSRRAGAAAPSRPRLARLAVEEAVGPGRNSAIAAAPTTAPPLRSAMRAQLWMEWRQKGRWFPFGILLWLAVAVGASALPVPETGALLRQALHDLLPFAVLLLPPAAGFLHASFHLRGQVTGIDSFRATRPLGDRELAHAILLSAARTWAAGLAATLASITALALGLWRFGNAARVEELARGIADAVAGIGAGRVALATGLGVAAAWAALGMVVAITLCGRNWLSLLAYVVPITAVSVIFIADVADVDLLDRAGPALIGPFGVVLTLGAAAAWVLAVRGRLLPLRAAMLAALSWVAGTVLLVRLMPTLFAALLVAGGSLPGWALLTAPGLAAAVVMPPALAPLALRWNRHR